MYLIKYYDATVENMYPDHRPYAVLAILVIVVGVFPLVLLLLCLNRCGLNSPGLQMFMQCFQGYYRDQTDGGKECRYFATVYPAFRIATFVMYSIAPSITFCFVFPLLSQFHMFLCLLTSSHIRNRKKLDFIMNLSLGIVIDVYLFLLI